MHVETSNLTDQPILFYKKHEMSTPLTIVCGESA